jgi:hypothetical protein
VLKNLCFVGQGLQHDLGFRASGYRSKIQDLYLEIRIEGLGFRV